MCDTRGVIHVHQRRIACFEQQLCVVVAADADINTRAGVAKSDWRLAGVFERLPTRPPATGAVVDPSSAPPAGQSRRIAARSDRPGPGTRQNEWRSCRARQGWDRSRRRHPSDPTAISRIPVTPSRNNCQNSSGSLAPPGMRHPTPMIAMGSCRCLSTVVELGLQFFNCKQGALQWREFRRAHGRFEEVNRSKSSSLQPF